MIFLRIFLILICLTLFPQIISANADQKNSPSLSFQGNSGYFYVPKARVVDDGSLEFAYTNSTNFYPYEDNILLTLGFLPRIEINFRLMGFYGSDKSYSGSDLSFSSQFLALSESRYLPSISAGWQDIGGESQFFSTKYFALSKHFTDFVETTLGYGLGPKRLDGIFGALSARLAQPIELIVEYDTDLVNSGVRLQPLFISSKIPDFIPKFKIDLVMKDISEKRDFFFGLSINFNLLNDQKTSSQTVNTTQVATYSKVANATIDENLVKKFQNELSNFGYLNLRTTLIEHKSRIRIEYENKIFNTNEMYAMRDILKRVFARFGNSIDSVELVIKKNNIALISFETGLVDYFNFVNGRINAGDYSKFIYIDNKFQNETGLCDVPLQSPGNFKADLIVRPELVTMVGTEVGMVDYKFNISPELYLPVIMGGFVNSKITFPTTESDDFDPRSKNPYLSRLLYNQTVKIIPDLYTEFSLGIFDEEHYGIFNESMYRPFDGALSISTDLAFILNYYSGFYLRKMEYLGKLKYFVPFLDLNLELTGGRFLYLDDGYIFSVNRFFDNKEIGFYIKHSDLYGYHGGVQLTIPLTTKKEPLKPYYIRPRLPDNYYYRLGSTLFQTHNIVRFKNNKLLERGAELNYIYFDEGRLNKNYILTHLYLLKW